MRVTVYWLVELPLYELSYQMCLTPSHLNSFRTDGPRNGREALRNKDAGEPKRLKHPIVTQ